MRIKLERLLKKMTNPNNKKKEKNKKRLEELIKGTSFVAFFFLFMFLIVSSGPKEFSLARLTGYVSFSSGPTMPPVYTDDNLECSWAHDDAINITLVWLNDSVYFSNVTGNTTTVTSPQSLASSNTAKGENWTCRITLFNTTANVTSQTSEIIVNSQPTIPKLYYSGSEFSSAFTMYEDIQYQFIINSTDKDNDDLIYSVLGPTDIYDLCLVNPDTGVIDCIVDHEVLDDAGIEILRYQNDTEFQVTDNDDGGVSNKIIDFTLIPINDAPIVALNGTVEDVTVETVYLQPFIVTDEENNSYNISSSLDVVKTSGPGSINYLEVNKTTEEIYFNTSDGSAVVVDYGIYNISITVFDSSNISNNYTLTYELIINSSNHAPNLTDVGSQSGVQGQPFMINLTAYEIDINDTLTYGAIHNSFNVFTNEFNYTVGNLTYFNATLNISALTNDNIVHRNFTIYVVDEFNLNDSIEINATLNNTNDAPLIYDNSSNSNNLNCDFYNITNLTAYLSGNFIYYINHTDVDNLTYEGEQLYFSMNESDPVFGITNEGKFTFYSVDESYIGDHYINITLNDDGTSNYVPGTNLSYSKIMVLHVLNNTIPYFATGPDNINCSEDLECYIVIDGADPNAGDNITYAIGGISLLNGYGNSSFDLIINSSSGVINFTPPQGDIGNYSIAIDLSDSRGAMIQESFNLTINNTNDKPSLTIIFPDTIYFEAPFSSNTAVTATDEDLDLANSEESLNYNFSLTPDIADLFVLNSSTGFVIINTSIPGCNQSYNITINVTDNSGETDIVNSSFIIQNIGNSPEIDAIYPYGNPSDNNALVLAWNSSLNEVSGGITTIITDEGSPIIFNHSTNDIDDPVLIHSWLINSVVVNDSRIIEDNHTLNLTNNYFSNGSYDIELFVNDYALNEVNWTWNLTIENVNRLPQIVNPLPNFTGDNSFSYIEVINYFTIPSIDQGNQRFYDPDDDINSNNIIDLDETSRLTYNFTDDCDNYTTILIVNDSITIIGTQVGSCSLYFDATDIDGGTIDSNEVFLNITTPYSLPDPEPITSSSSNSVIVPISLSNDDDPVPLEIITAKSVVIYQDSTMVIPIELKNNWTTELTGLSVFVRTGENNVDYNLTESYFNSLSIGESKYLDLIVYNYREPGSYEIEVSVDVVSPEFEDTATIIINSLEESHKGETLETKLAFARDLLNSNEDCKELYEILSQAEESLEAGNQEKTLAYLDLTINACKYMISNRDLISTDKTDRINLVIDYNFLRNLLENRVILVIVSISLIVIIGSLIFYRRYRLKKSRIEEAEEYASVGEGLISSETTNKP